MIDESDKFGKLTVTEYALLTKQERDIYDEQKDNIIYAKYRESLQQTMYETQKLLAALPAEVHKGLNEVRIMFLIQFGFGIALVISAVALSLISPNSTGAGLGSLILGGAGAATLVTSLIMTPPMRLQDNRVDLSQWLMAYNRWFYTTYNVDNIERKRMRWDPDLERDWGELEYYNNYVSTATKDAAKLMEDYCEFQKPLGTANGGNNGNNKSSTPAKTNGNNSKQATSNGNSAKTNATGK